MHNVKEHEIEDEIKKALIAFPEAEKALKVLFPKYFENQHLVLLYPTKHGTIDHRDMENGTTMQAVRIFSESGSVYRSKAVVLSQKYNWRLTEEGGNLLLIPTEKE